MNIPHWVRRASRFVLPSGLANYCSGYDFSSDEIQDLQQRNPAPFTTRQYDMSLPAWKYWNDGQEQVLEIPCRAVSFIAWTRSGGQTVSNVEAFMKLWVNVKNGDLQTGFPEGAFPMKHGRGIRGDIARVYLDWEPQGDAIGLLIFHHFDDLPWQGIESDA